jgi:excisionase family DNA binding protein
LTFVDKTNPSFFVLTDTTVPVIMYQHDRIMSRVKGKGKTKEDCMEQTILPVTMSVEEAHQALGGRAVISKATFYLAVQRGEVPHLKLGKRILIPRAAFMKWLESGSLAGSVKA